MKRSSMVGFLALVLAGCGDGDGASGSVPVDEIGERMGAVMCERLFACCTTEELMDEALGADSVEECEAVFGGFIDTLLEPVIQDSIDAGRIVYHGDEIGSCVDAYAALTCGELAEVQASDGPFTGCEAPFEPQVVDGGECANDFDCVSTYCAGDTVDFQTGEITYGTCADAPGVGQACDDFECGDDAYCDSSGGTPTCQATLSNGSGCTSDDECASDFCDGGGQCAENMTCDGVP